MKSVIKKKNESYYIYMLRCKDNSLYTGITNDLNNRMNQHFSKSKAGAKYTKSHDGLKVEICWKCKNKSLALKLEYQLKTLTKKQKEELINNKKINLYLKDKIDSRHYRSVSIEKLIEEKYIANNEK